MKKVLKYIVLTVVLLSDLYSALFLILTNTELILALSLLIFAATILAMIVYNICKDVRAYKRAKETQELLEAMRKEERVKELIKAIEGNKDGNKTSDD